MSIIRETCGKLWRPTLSIEKQSDIFKSVFRHWKVLGIWPGKELSKYYKYYSFAIIGIMTCIYFTIIAVNLFFTPLEVDKLVHEIMYFFSEINSLSKVVTVLMMKNEIMEIIDMMDSDDFKSDDEECKQIIKKANANHITFWKMYETSCLLALIMQAVGVPTVLIIMGSKVELITCSCYLLSDDVKNKYFKLLYAYQAFGMYCHMKYTINMDSFIAGIILIAITQLRVLHKRLIGLRVDGTISKLKATDHDTIQIIRLNRCLKHYNVILRFCSKIQTIASFCMFAVLSTTALNICVTLTGLIMVPPTQSFLLSVMFYTLYVFVLALQVFIPGSLGTALSHESASLVTAAYSCEWVPRSEPFKRSLRLFMERAKTPVVLTAISMFPLNLDSCIAILKTSYSFFTLLWFFLGKNDDSH